MSILESYVFAIFFVIFIAGGVTGTCRYTWRTGPGLIAAWTTLVALGFFIPEGKGMPLLATLNFMVTIPVLAIIWDETFGGPIFRGRPKGRRGRFYMVAAQTTNLAVCGYAAICWWLPASTNAHVLIAHVVWMTWIALACALGLATKSTREDEASQAKAAADIHNPNLAASATRF